MTEVIEPVSAGTRTGYSTYWRVFAEGVSVSCVGGWVCVVSREWLTINLQKLLSAQESKDGRIVTKDHAKAVDFLVRYQDSKDEPQDGRHQW